MIKRKSNFWDKWIYPLPKNTDTVFCSAVIAELAKSGPYSKHLSEMYESGRLRDLIEFSVPFECGLDDYRSSVQIQALFKKNLDIDLGYDPLKAGVEAFIKAEKQCQETNRYFGLPAPFWGVAQAISLARRKIAYVLGPVPPLNRLQPRLGPGASTTVKRRDACFENKLVSPITCSESIVPVIDSFLAETPGWTRYHSGEWSRSGYVEGSENVLEWTARDLNIAVDVGSLLFVEKNAKTHRPICVEPGFNGFWQLGVGDYIKDRLNIRANQNLRDQSRNRELARRGSIDGSLATIDLSSASDTVSYSVVYDLLPECWVDLLDKLRTPVIRYEGYELELEKFSSMGNGFTFELESLIFWAISSACTELCSGDQKDVSVYGDDIIVPTGATVELLYASLTWCGFSVNPEKSFHQGNFRESCGADWLNGDDVRPIFKKDRLTIQWLFLFHNWSMRRGEVTLASIARAFIPDAFQFTGPDGYGDGHLLGSYELKRSRTVRRRGWEGGYFTTLRESPKSVKTDMSGSFLYALYSSYTSAVIDVFNPSVGRRPGTVPGSTCVEKTSIYTLSEHIFVR